MKYRTQIASDVDRDGIGVELLNEKEAVIAEIFRSDKTKAVFINTFDNDISLEALKLIFKRAKDHWKTFEDGTPIDWEL